jgi:hypothetical protein
MAALDASATSVLGASAVGASVAAPLAPSPLIFAPRRRVFARERSGFVEVAAGDGHGVAFDLEGVGDGFAASDDLDRVPRDGVRDRVVINLAGAVSVERERD